MALAWWLLAAGVAAVAAHVPLDSEDYIKPKGSKATSHSFTISVPCVAENMCEKVSLIYKKTSSKSEPKPKEFENSTIIDGLESNTEYEVHTTVSFFNGSKVMRDIKFRTCPAAVPKLGSIRVAKTGPGWLDVRWRPVRDTSCDSSIYYRVQYGVDGGKLSEWMSYGVFSKPTGESVFRPTHPCAAWDAEFCLLLTDDVKPGENHTIKVKPVRYDPGVGPKGNGSEGNASDADVVTQEHVLADAKVSGAYKLGARDALSPCVSAAHQTLPTTAGGSESTGRTLVAQPVVVPIWAIVLAALVLVLAIVVFVAARWCRRSISKNASLLNEVAPESRSPPSDPHVFRSSNVYDDCLSHVHMGNNTIPENSATRVPEPLYEQFKGLQGAAPQGMQFCLSRALAAAAAAKVTGKPEPAPATNHYVAMTSQPVYDDAEGLKRDGLQPTHTNASGHERESNIYMEPSSPLYDEAKGLGTRSSEASGDYNRPYSQAKTGPWRAW